MPVLFNGTTADVDLLYNIFIAGVTFDDGTTNKKWSLNQLPSPLDPLDPLVVVFQKSSAWGAVCHRGSIYQNGVRISHMY
jgi:hypothetical protein